MTAAKLAARDAPALHRFEEREITIGEALHVWRDFGRGSRCVAIVIDLNIAKNG